MSRLDQATERLRSAIERLDRAVVARGGDGGAPAAELRAALERAERERSELRSAATQASERLDAAIDRLRKIMGD